MGPDIVEKCQAVAALSAVDADSWVPLFEPHDFTRENESLLIEQYKLPPRRSQIMGRAGREVEGGDLKQRQVVPSYLAVVYFQTRLEPTITPRPQAVQADAQRRGRHGEGAQITARAR